MPLSGLLPNIYNPLRFLYCYSASVETVLSIKRFNTNNLTFSSRLTLFFKMFSRTIFAELVKASSTLYAVFAEVSKNINPCSFASASPSSNDTCLLVSKSFLLPIRMMTVVFELLFLTSSNHFVTWVKVSRLVMS